MPNWVDQEFVVVGPRDDLDRFCALGVTGNFRRDHALDGVPTFHFDCVCPITKVDARDCGDEHRTAVLVQFLRSHTLQPAQALASHSGPEAPVGGR